MRRRQLGLTQAQVAAACDTSFQQIQKLEAGELGISVVRLILLAAALQVPPDYLYHPAGVNRVGRPCIGHKGRPTRRPRPGDTGPLGDG
jgi:transcriptional regulator with XRE-family HTH domain